MKQKITVEQLVGAWPSMVALAGMKLKIQPSFWVSRTFRKLEPEFQDWDRQRIELLKAHGATEKAPGTGQFDVPDDQQAAVDEVFRELMESEIEIDVEQKPTRFLGDVQIEGMVLARLYFLFTDADQPEPAAAPNGREPAAAAG